MTNPLVLFIVRNSDGQPFPFDMLTHDRCWPMSPQDGQTMIDTHKDRRGLAREVRLYSRALGSYLARDLWAARGWPISSVQQIR